MVKKKSKKVSGRWKAVPLKGSFMAFAIIGFFVSAYMINDVSWRIAFLIVFVAMFVASLISMTKAPLAKEGY